MRKIILFVAGMFLFLAISGCGNTVESEPQEEFIEDTVEEDGDTIINIYDTLVSEIAE